MTTSATVVAPWRLFTVRVWAQQQLTPAFLRVTVTGEDLDAFADNGFDQRFKLVLPLPGRGLADLPGGEDWYPRWRALPAQRRNPIRTYTVRAVRPAAREVDVDIVCHHGTGPAARWAAACRPGDELALIGPDAGFPADHGGVEFRPPGADATLLLAGDETAVPAITAILERLPATARGEALLEVPVAADALPVAAPPGVRLRWLARHGRRHGSELVAALTSVWPAEAAAPPERGEPAPDPMLWEVPEQAPEPGGRYAWVAGEAGMVREVRRHLRTGCGLDRRATALMGYWRLGHAEAA